MNTTRLLQTAVLAACALAINAQGQAIYAWRGLSDTNWQNTANWSNSTIVPLGVTTFGRVNVTNHPTTGFPLSHIADYGTTRLTNSAGRALVMANGAGQFGRIILWGGTWESGGNSPDVLANAGGNGWLTLNGGNYYFTNIGGKNLNIVLSTAGSVGAVTNNSGNMAVDTLSHGQDSTASGNSTMSLNGGTLAVKVITDSGSTVNSTNNFNGGTLIALASTAAFIVADANNVQAGGLKLDSQAFNVGIGKPLLNGVAGTDGGLYKSGSGSLFLAVSNSYNGGTTLSNGTIIFATNGLTTSGAITIAGTSGLKWTNNNEDISARISAIPGGATLTLDDGGNNIALGSSLSGGGGITKAGSGTMTLNAANSFGGNVTVSAGALRVANNSALGNTAGASTVNAGRMELANGVNISGETLTITGDGGNNVGGLQTLGGATAVWNGPLFPTGSNTRIGAQTNGTLEIAGQITGNTSLIIRNGSSSPSASDYGTVIFSAANNYTADLQLAGGTLRLSGGNDRLTPGYRVVMGSNTLYSTLDLNGTSPDIAGIVVASTSVGVQTIGSSSTTSDSTLSLGSGSGVSTTNTFTGIIKDTLGSGSRKVGITVAGGQVTLTGTNSYTGGTVISAGRLIGTPTSLGVGALTLNDSAVLTLNLPAAGGTVTNSDLTFSGSNPKTLEVSLVSGNPTGPILRATNLVLGGTVSLNLSGFGLSIGSIQLIDYDTLGGTGDFVTNSLPAGVSAHIETNLVTSSIDLVIDSVPSLVWLGQTNGVPAEGWDIGLTTNWFDRALSQPGVFLNGLNVVFDDSVTNNNGTNWVTLATNVQPFVLSVSNNAVDYTFSNSGGTNTIRGSARLIKDGAATLTLAVSNNAYAGYTHVKAGALKLAALAALPAVPLTNDALVDLNGFNTSPGALSGNGVITNSTGGATTNTLSIGNGGTAGDFSGRIDDGAAGKVALQKAGAGAQILRNSASTYSGGTALTNATLLLGNDNVLGSGPVALSSSTLSSEGSSTRVVTNPVTIAISSGFGAAGNTGAFKLTGPLDFNGGNRNFTNNVPLIVSGNSQLSAGGIAAKHGAETLTLQSNLVNWISGIEVQAGTMIVDGATWTNGGSIRTVGINANAVTRLVLTNNALVVVTNSVGVLRGGNSNGSSTGTNIFDIAATLMFPTPGAASTDGKVLLGNACNRGTVNLLSGGLLVARAIQRDTTGGGNHDAEFNFDGGTLKPSASDAASAFMQGLTEAKIRAGGAIIDTTNINVTIGQSFTEDPASTGGGLTKQGTGALLLTGGNTYTGTTLVSAGTLGGTGVLSGPVTVSSSAFLAPGTANIGTFIISNTLTLGGTTRIEVNRASAQNCDRITGITTLNRGGTLEVQNLGATLLPGDSFNVFSAAAHSGQFAAISPSTPNGDAALGWDTNAFAGGSLVVHRIPVASNSSAGGVLGVTIQISVAKLLSHCFDGDGDALTIVSVSVPVNGGTTVLNGTNTLDYTAPLSGTNDSFTYTVSDGRGGTATATVSVSLIPDGANFNRVGIETLGNGDAKLTYRGIPGYNYALDWAHYMTNPIPWIPLITNQADGTGLLEFTNTPSGGNDFYRTRDVP
jgi:autotransporter-associated beta strand protein